MTGAFFYIYNEKYIKLGSFKYLEYYQVVYAKYLL